MRSPFIYLIKPGLHNGRWYEDPTFINVGPERAIKLDKEGAGLAVSRLMDYVEIYRFDDELDADTIQLLQDFFYGFSSFRDDWKDDSWYRLISYLDVITEKAPAVIEPVIEPVSLPADEPKAKKTRKKKNVSTTE